MLAGTANAAPAISFSDMTISAASPTMAAGYFTATSAVDDKIIGVASDCCDAVELHKNEMKDNIMRMRKIEALPLKAGVPTLAQQTHGAGESVHVMLIGPKKLLKKGDEVKVTFSFEHAPKQTVLFTVSPNQPDAHAHH